MPDFVSSNSWRVVAETGRHRVKPKHFVRTAMRTLFDIIGQSVATLWAHKLRSFLTMFGIAWGVGSLLLLVGLGEGFRSGQARQLSNLGQDIMFVLPGRIPAVEGSYQSGPPYHFTYKDYL